MEAARLRGLDFLSAVPLVRRRRMECLLHQDLFCKYVSIYTLAFFRKAKYYLK